MGKLILSEKLLRMRESNTGGLSGVLVKRDGDLIDVCGKNDELYGVFEEGHDRITISLDDERIITKQPMGIVRRGQMDTRRG